MAAMRSECVWFDQHQYESVEARYQGILANRFLGLKVEVSRMLFVVVFKVIEVDPFPMGIKMVGK